MNIYKAMQSLITRTPEIAYPPPLTLSLAAVVTILALIGLSRELIDQRYPVLPMHTPDITYVVDSGSTTAKNRLPGKSIEVGLVRDSAEQADLETRYVAVEEEQTRLTGRLESDPENRPAPLNPSDTAGNLAGEGRPRRKAGIPVESVLVTDALYKDEASFAEVDAIKESRQAERGNKTEKKKVVGRRDKFDADDRNSTPARVFEFENTGYGQFDKMQSFLAPTGYWANTYIPGDANIRLLRARLAEWSRSGLAGTLPLEQAVRPVSQPFDAPADNALSLSLMSDANAIDGATRMRLQVGIRGIEHRRGQRPAMNMGVVIDLHADVEDSTRIAARALVEAVLANQQVGDRFSLAITGPGGLLLPPEEFRFGPLQVAMRSIIGGAIAGPTRDRNLAETISDISALVRQSDDPSRPLGSSSILLISANMLDNIDQLVEQVHIQAADGITLSVVPLGGLPQNQQIEQLVLAGLGHRRVLEAPDQAHKLIETELYSSSRAVARAARLSIRLAQGVHLIEVVGSNRLDAESSRRVRDIENSMDHRLSANLGIQADRGKDEDGIQIVIPSIYSGDDVTVLLDVLVEQPGEIATVSLRYKDLVYLKNGNLQGQMSLPAGQFERGPAQHSVIKNLLAHRFSHATGKAADALGRRQRVQTVEILSDIRRQIVDLRLDVPALYHDPDLLRDERVLDSYLELLVSDVTGTHQPELADSLRYASWAKAHRPLAEWK